jgi:hypothetical protein
MHKTKKGARGFFRITEHDKLSAVALLELGGRGYKGVMADAQTRVASRQTKTRDEKPGGVCCGLRFGCVVSLCLCFWRVVSLLLPSPARYLCRRSCFLLYLPSTAALIGMARLLPGGFLVRALVLVGAPSTQGPSWAWAVFLPPWPWWRPGRWEDQPPSTKWGGRGWPDGPMARGSRGGAPGGAALAFAPSRAAGAGFFFTGGHLQR